MPLEELGKLLGRVANKPKPAGEVGKVEAERPKRKREPKS